jgi:predicted nucleic acid-binding protein
VSLVSAPVVIDASALLEYVLGERQADAVEAVLRTPNVRLHAPEIVDLEVLSAIRRLERAKQAPADRLEHALLDAGSLLIELHALRPYFDRVWTLRHQITVADSYYVGLAETLGAALLTTDGKLAAAATSLTAVQVVDLASAQQGS